MERYLISDQDEFEAATEALDDAMIDYDIDGGDRIMIDPDDIESVNKLFDDLFINYEVI